MPTDFMRPHARVYCLASAVILLALCLLVTLGGCQTATGQAATAAPFALPRLLRKIELPAGGYKGILRPDHQVDFLTNTGVSVIDETGLLHTIPLPNLNPPYGQNLYDIGRDAHTGLLYVIDQSTSVIHIISDTALIATLAGMVNDPLQVVADEDSGEMYVFYHTQKSGDFQVRAAIISDTRVITDINLPLFNYSAIQYNPVDGHIYLAGNHFASDSTYDNALTVIDNHQIITTIHPLDKPDLAVGGMAINRANGDVYVLVSNKVVYWDRVHPPQSIDLYARGYTQTIEGITVDPKRGWAYVCAWMVPQSYVLVLDKNRLLKAIPVAKWPAVAAVDAKHDYVYVGHYDPTNLSVIRGTELITTLNIIGEGTSGLVVDEANDKIYTANGDDGTVDVFGFDPPTAVPTFWQTYLPWLGK